MMKEPTTLLWFRQDLRITANPALLTALDNKRVLAVYILDDTTAGDYAMGAASRWWLHHSLLSLNKSLHQKLNFYAGDATSIITDICNRFNIENVYWNRCYEPWRISRDKIIKQDLVEQGITAESFNASLLHEPWSVLKEDGTPYKVYTPYNSKANSLTPTLLPSPPPVSRKVLLKDSTSVCLDSLRLLPKIAWDKGFYESWSPGEESAHTALTRFLDSSLYQYKEGRDYPALESVSKLSPHLHFGEIAPQQLIDALEFQPDDDNKEHFKKEVRWREFSYSLLYHWPNLPKQNFKTSFDNFPWQNNPERLKAWQQGKTGYPLVDAGMRELWQTGSMHNRVRMITASFLIKNLLIDWRLGASWFWDCLLDADLASNSASWQWVAGSGTDASPYFRVFNPITQGEKFDPQGVYTRRFLPELRNLPDKFLFKPWLASPEILAEAGVVLGTNYPEPIVDIKESRLHALESYERTKQAY